MTSYARRQRQRDRRIGAAPNPNEVVVPSQRFGYLVVLAAGLLLTGFGFVLLSGPPGLGAWKAAACAIVPGMFIVVVAVRPALSSSPLLRADAEGVELGHCPKLPWAAIRAVHPPSIATIAIHVDRRYAWRHMPFGMYVRHRFTGCVLLEVPGREPATTVAARLHEMRMGGEVAVAAGAEFPSARVVKR